MSAYRLPSVSALIACWRSTARWYRTSPRARNRRRAVRPPCSAIDSAMLGGRDRVPRDASAPTCLPATPRDRDRPRAPRGDARLRQRVADPRPGPRRLPRAGRIRARDEAHRARDRRRPDLPAASRRHGPGGVDADGAVGRPPPARHRAEPPAVDGRGPRPRHGRAARRDARVRGRPAGGARAAARPSRGATTGSAWTGAFRAPAPPRAPGRPRAADARARRASSPTASCSGSRVPRTCATSPCPRSRAAAPGPGKPLEGFEIVAAGPARRDRGPRRRHARLFREELVRYLSLPYYRTMFRASGFGDALAAFDRDRGPGRDADAVPRRAGRRARRDRGRAAARGPRWTRTGRPASRFRSCGRSGRPESAHARATLEAVAP